MTPYALFGLIEAEKAGYPSGNDPAVERGLDRLGAFLPGLADDAHAADWMYCVFVWGQRREVPAEWWQVVQRRLEGGLLSDQALALALELAVQKKQALAKPLAEALRQRAKQGQGQAHWETAGFSRWHDDPLEVTAAALQALVAYDADDPLIPEALAWFAARKRGDRWNSTRDTALIVSAMSDYLAKKRFDVRQLPKLAFRCNDGPLTPVAFADGAAACRVAVPAAQLQAGANRLTFAGGAEGVLYRLTLRYHPPAPPARDVTSVFEVLHRLALPHRPPARKLEVQRTFWLLDGKGQRLRELRPGDVVRRGSFIECVVGTWQQDNKPMSYVLLEMPRPAGCEVMAADDPRFSLEQIEPSTPYSLREEREALVAFHYEEAPSPFVARCVLHAEMVGDLVVPPARVELMYQTETFGHSDAFRIRVQEKTPGWK
jgi:uncharacterized protein YfaS (alpha-2-macroglobulin family)